MDVALARVRAGTHELLDLTRAPAEIGEHQTYDAVRNTVEAASASGGTGKSDTDRANSS